MVCGGPASTTSHSHHNRDGWVILRVCARSVIHAQVVGSASTANAVVQNTFRDSQRVVCPSVGPRMILRGPCERLHGGGGCSHQLRAQVHGGAVIKFLVNLSKTQTSSASLNGRRMRQRDAGRAVLISFQRQIQSLPSKKQLWVWVRHKSAVIYRLPLRNHYGRHHDCRRTEENPRTSPCTALSCL